MSDKYRVFLTADGYAVYELDADQPYTDPIEFTYSRYSDVSFKSEKSATGIAAHLNYTNS